MMSATMGLINGRVGEGGAKVGPDVKRLQQLLVANGVDLGPAGADGHWGQKTSAALTAYQKECKVKGLASAGEKPKPDPAVVEQAWVNPKDPILGHLARAASLIIPLPGKRGIDGVVQMHQWFVDNGITYQKGAEKGKGTRATFGLDGHDDLAIQTTGEVLKRGPVQMDCTTYVNLMLGVFARGDLHGAPYDASTPYGWENPKHMARDRYMFPLLTRDTASARNLHYFDDPDDILGATTSGNLYVMELAGTVTNPKTNVKMHGAVTHMALLFEGDTYECTTGQPGSACISRGLKQFFNAANGRIVYLFGPRPV